MFSKVSPNHPNKLADRVAGALVDQAYLLKKSPRIEVEVGYNADASECHVKMHSNFYLDKSVVEGIVKRIMGDGTNVEFEHVLVDNYATSCCETNASVVVSYPNDENRRAVSVCNDVFKSTGKVVKCIASFPDVIVCTNGAIEAKDVEFSVNHNDVIMDFKETEFKVGASNEEIGSDIGTSQAINIHGVDLMHPEATLAIYAHLKVESKGGTIAMSCKKGDTSIGKDRYMTIVNKVKGYINSVGGFEKFAEWGFLRPFVRD